MAVEVLGPVTDRQQWLMSSKALDFLETLHQQFDAQRQHLLTRRQEIQHRLNRGGSLNFLPETEGVRHDGAWQVDPIPEDLMDRRVEITGPTDAKMVINALNSGARVFMADFEDAASPTWENLLEGQSNLAQAIDGTLHYTSDTGKEYQLQPKRAVLVVRPRGWHLSEAHVLVDGQPLSGSLFDFGLYLFHNHARLRRHGTGPYFYLPKLESYAEAHLWNAVFDYAEQAMGMEPGTIKATVLIETIPAALQMEEILYVLRRHIVGLNAGRWDYLFSIIKRFREHPDAVLPDRAQVTMEVPFMRAYAELLVDTCHKRGAHAIGGMAAFIPSRRDPEVNRLALSRVRDDKRREAEQGFDGTWVAHPDLVETAQAAFDAVLGSNPHQKHRRNHKTPPRAADLLSFPIVGGSVTEAGVRNNVAVSLQYLTAWLQGQGAVGLYNLMEDAATAEIARAQLYQWRYHRVTLADGRLVTGKLLAHWLDEMAQDLAASREATVAHDILRAAILDDQFLEFITEPAYRALIDHSAISTPQGRQMNG